MHAKAHRNVDCEEGGSSATRRAVAAALEIKRHPPGERRRPLPPVQASSRRPPLQIAKDVFSGTGAAAEAEGKLRPPSGDDVRRRPSDPPVRVPRGGKGQEGGARSSGKKEHARRSFWIECPDSEAHPRWSSPSASPSSPACRCSGGTRARQRAAERSGLKRRGPATRVRRPGSGRTREARPWERGERAVVGSPHRAPDDFRPSVRPSPPAQIRFVGLWTQRGLPGAGMRRGRGAGPTSVKLRMERARRRPSCTAIRLPSGVPFFPPRPQDSRSEDESYNKQNRSNIVRKVSCNNVNLRITPSGGMDYGSQHPVLGTSPLRKGSEERTHSVVRDR
jgi:hypothetical protein